jgi:hypothetical protein
MSDIENRESAAKRGYGRRWQKYRERYLREHPLCVMHQQQGQTVAADVVDHIVPHKGDHKLFWDPKNPTGTVQAVPRPTQAAPGEVRTVIGCGLDGVYD